MASSNESSPTNQIASQRLRLHHQGRSITYISANENWEMSVCGRNLSDERETIGTITVSFSEPRRYFVSQRYRNERYRWYTVSGSHRAS